MDFDVCVVCHRRIDFRKLDEAYPHLAEGSDHLPPEGMSRLEQAIYWGAICHDCARSAEGGQEHPDPHPVQKPFQRSLQSAHRARRNQE